MNIVSLQGVSDVWGPLYLMQRQDSLFSILGPNSDRIFSNWIYIRLQSRRHMKNVLELIWLEEGERHDLTLLTALIQQNVLE